MSARRQIIASLSEDSMGGIATLQDVDRAEALVAAHRVEVLNEALDTIREYLRVGGQQQIGLLVARKRILALIKGTTPEPPRRNVSHKAVAERCRKQPGEWLTVGEYANDMTAYAIVRAIVKGHGSVVAYLPPGTFEARSEQTETGTVVSARYVGPAAEADRAQADTVRPDNLRMLPADFYEPGYVYSYPRYADGHDWKFRCDAITTHPDDGARVALGWRHWHGEWTECAYDEGNWDVHNCDPAGDLIATSDEEVSS